MQFEDPERIKARILKTIVCAACPKPELGDCWLWRPHDRRGYARIQIGNRKYRLHRVAYELWVGPIPPGLLIDHLCRVHNCCNPRHLEVVWRS